MDSLIAAHEIGHNFGAPHDGQAGSACEAEPQTFIMSPYINGSDQFSACSITEMQDNIVAAACIVPLPSVDMTISQSGQAPAPLLGNSVTVTFDVINNGTTQASNVAVDVTLPNNVTFLSASSSVGSCTNGAGSVNCALGDVPGSTARTVTVTSRADTVGVGVFNATVSSDADDDATNNQASIQVTVDPAVDLVANASAPTNLTIDLNTTISGTIDNLSTLGATGVSLTISLAAGLRADTAMWSAGSCNITALQVDCQAASFGAQSTSTISITVTGTTVGAKNYTLTLASNEIDANPADNSASGSITVQSVDDAANNEDSGVGGTGPVILWLLLLAFLTRHWRRSAYFASTTRASGKSIAGF